ncbi:hypothetical protein AX769_11245 [Frondihabitans sp. PAMC 28766]|uniref:class I SAM-dependent methyltransferase n=1 Tax=Frondihabitans sp. PAMC 28766 TaxID=1795630 RepID=UPI00078CD566|nr:class I SAM-dependent methyltransferase [Frondihabitans sp. PAMC 28766]AMM20608.1 hypothetical protein AX769_11245 [Frondihabitans sp. PAMC 28766]
MTPTFDQPFWDDLYSASDRIWSGRPNPHLVTEASALTPGTALDIGSGEGGDAVWLASHGWQVTAVDLSEVALARADAHWQQGLTAQDATGTGSETPSRVSWQHRDILQWSPLAGAFDLVSSQYSHFPTAVMHELVGRLAAAVAPGGTLLVVGHEDHGHRHADDSSHAEHAHTEGAEAAQPKAEPFGPEFFYTPDELAGLLAPAEWEILVREFRPHPAREGRDAVLRARRRP